MLSPFKLGAAAALLAFVILPHVGLSQSVSPGKYVDLAGSEDYYVNVKNGVVISAECGRVCPDPKGFRIVGINKSVNALKVITPWGKTLSLCLASSAPKWARMQDVAYCEFKAGWTRRRPK